MARKDLAEDGLGLYYRSIERFPVLPDEEQRELARRAQRGDVAAMQRLVEHNLKFVIRVALKYKHADVALNDLVQAGNHGLIKAVYRYNPELRYRFITYAVWWIRQMIYDLIGRTSRPVRLPVHIHYAVIVVSRVRERLRDELERLPTLEELVAATRLKEREVKVAVSFLDQSANVSAGTTDGEELYIDPFDSCAVESDIMIDASICKSDIHRSLKRLTKRERLIVVRYYGLEGHEPSTLEGLVPLLNLTRERIRQLKNDALEKLKDDDCLQAYA